jgi:hypothetical protein
MQKGVNSRRDSANLIEIEDITLSKKDLQCLRADLPDGPERYVYCMVVFLSFISKRLTILTNY